MARIFKNAALAFLGAVVIAAGWSSVALANEWKTSATEASIEGEAEAVTTIAIGTRTLECKKVTYKGNLLPKTAKASKELTLAPTFEQCEFKIAGVGFDATVTVEGCDFVLLEPASGKVDFKCPAETKLVIHVYNGKSVTHNEANIKCKYTIAEQKGLTGMVYKNGKSGIHNVVTMSPAVAKIAVTRIAGTLADCGAELGQTATWSGTALLTAQKAGQIEFEFG